MSSTTVEFIDTNILVYAHDRGAGDKYRTASALVARLSDADAAGVSIQVLSEFYATVTRKLKMESVEAEGIIADYAIWTIHQPAHADLLKAARLQRRYRLSWWDALLVHSAIELGCRVLWSEDLSDGQKYGPITVRNPFH